MENPTTEAAPVKKRNFKKLIILLLAVFLLLGAAGGGAYYLFGTRISEAKSKKEKSQKDSADESGEESADSEKEKQSSKSGLLKDFLPDDENVKQIVELQPFIVNLADVEEARYLRLTVSLGIGGESAEKKEADQIFNTRVRNAILAVISAKKSEEILTVEGKTKLRKEILEAAQAVSREPEVEAVYITEFIVQL